MGYFEKFKKKQVNIMQGKQVTVEYIKAKKYSEILPSADGDMILIKHIISPDDVSWLKSYRGSCKIFTTNPDTLVAYDIQQQLMKSMTIKLLKSIGLNYLHFNDTLYIFGDFNGFDFESNVPNMIRIHPVNRNDFETQISFDTGILDAAFTNEKLLKIQSTQKNFEDSEQQSSTKEVISEKDSPEKQSSMEVDLVRAELKNIFDSLYIVVKVELKGASIEKKTISLSEFYNKHNIAKGRLKGSWSLFGKEQISQIIDEGIARKAIDVADSQFTVNIDGYGRIIQIVKKDNFIAVMHSIENDYISYLRGNNESKKIGEIEIKTRFTPSDALKVNQSELLGYLIGFCPMQELETEKYISDVNRFIDESYWKLTDFASNVELKIVQSTYTEGQWRDLSFVNKVWKTCNDRHNRQFFTQQFVTLLKRYIKLLQV